MFHRTEPMGRQLHDASMERWRLREEIKGLKSQLQRANTGAERITLENRISALEAAHAQALYVS